MCRVAKDRGRINSSAGRCLTLRCSQTLSTRCISVQGCGALSDAGQLCRGGYLGARVDLGHPWLGGVGMCTVRLPTPPLTPPCSSRLVAAAEGHGVSGRPSGPDSVWCQPCLANATSLLHLPLPCLALQAWCIICTCPAACCNRCLPRPTFASWYTTAPPSSGRPKLPRIILKNIGTLELTQQQLDNLEWRILLGASLQYRFDSNSNPTWSPPTQKWFQFHYRILFPTCFVVSDEIFPKFVISHTGSG